MASEDANPNLQALIDAELHKPMKPEELHSAFDCGSWAAVQSLIIVLRRRGILDDSAFSELCSEMLAVRDDHLSRGETVRAEDVETAEHNLARVAGVDLAG